MSQLRKQVRVEQTLSEIERVQNEFDRWKARRDSVDEKHQYRTQLAALQEVVDRALKDTSQDTTSILDDAQHQSIGTLYERCRLQEKRLLWIQRVLWEYYRQKFDQRDQSDDLKKLLEAADDVVWSCYKGVFQRLDSSAPLNPIPLAYIEAFYSPQALPRDEPPGLLKEKRLGDRFLADFFTRLPIPLVSMPPNCLSAPWWLVYVGHEVGHHVQHDLGLVAPFALQLFEVACKAPAPQEEGGTAQRWADWGQEIFADVFSIYVMGASALWAMAELETHPDRDMILRKERYPSPAVRLALLDRLAINLGLAGREAASQMNVRQWLDRSPADEFEGELQAELAADLAMLDKMVAALASQKAGDLAPFRIMTGWNSGLFDARSDMRKWRDDLLAGELRQRPSQLTSARLIVAAGVGAWREITTSPAAGDRAGALDRLGSQLLDTIEAHRDKTTRAADERALQDVGAVAADISAQLRQAEFFEW